MGVTKREQEIIDLDESGLTQAQIAAQLGLSEAYVYQIVQALCRGVGRDSKFNAMIARGSRKLLMAINTARAA